jgi:hypothetical protein
MTAMSQESGARGAGGAAVNGRRNEAGLADQRRYSSLLCAEPRDERLVVNVVGAGRRKEAAASGSPDGLKTMQMAECVVSL